MALWLVAAAYLALHGQPATGRDEGGAFALSAVLALLMVGLTAPAPAPPWRQPPHPSRTRLWAQVVVLLVLLALIQQSLLAGGGWCHDPSPACRCGRN